MKIKLLNDGGYRGLEGVKFPVIVDAIKHEKMNVSLHVPDSEMSRISNGVFNKKTVDSTFAGWPFTIHYDCEVIE
jgi:hypothetical protein